jgi:hypothetical protein
MGRSATIDSERKAQASHTVWAIEFENDPRWLVAQRVVASQHFVRSRLLSKFLLYIVSETLADRKSEITEHQIGVHVFERPASYSSVEDNIVRTYARQLRRRLAEYFATEGASEPLQIDIPLGGYIPVFATAPTLAPVKPIGEEQAQPVPIAVRIEPSESATRPAEAAAGHVRRWKRPLLLTLSLAAYSIALVTLAWFAATRFREHRTSPPPVEPIRQLWAALFGGPANCYIVPADAGFNLLEDLLHHPTSLALYMKGSYLTQPLSQIDDHSAEDLRTQQFTSFTDLQIVTALARLPEFNPQRVLLRFPRELRLDDLKNANAIILGSMGSNPWAAIAQSNANFRIVNDGAMQGAKIINTKPESGEAASYVSHWNQPAHETFAIIAYLPNLDGNGRLLLLQGLDVAGTQAAAETLIHPDTIAPILQRATRPNGSLRSFEILLRSSSIESESAGTTIIGSRIY